MGYYTALIDSITKVAIVPTSNTLFKLENVTWSPGGQVILDGLSLSIPENTVTGIIGPNGAGKTSLLKLLNGLLKPTSGSIEYLQQDLNTLPLRQKAKNIAFAAQHPDFSFSLSLFDVVRAGRLPHRSVWSFDNSDDKFVIAALEQFDLLSLANRAFNSLSGGEQQRAFLARTIVQQAKTILLDEPTNHLDIHYQLQLMQDISDFNGNVIMTLHDLNFAAQYCDYLILLNKGRLVAQGTPEQVLLSESLSNVYQVIVETQRLPNNKLQLAYCLPEASQANSRGGYVAK